MSKSLTLSGIDIEKLEDELRGLSIREIIEHPTKSREEIAFGLFEIASEKESNGQLSDASDYYWKAFKLDDKVDVKYRERFFKKKEEQQQQHQLEKNGGKEIGRATTLNGYTKPLELNRAQMITLLDSYQSCEFIAEDEEKMIFFEKLPYEVIEHIFEILLEWDTPSWINLSLVSKKLAYIGFRDKNIWSHLSKLVYDRQQYSDNDAEKFKYLINSQWGINSYKMLNERPYLKYHGVYISKVSYMKEGARSENSNSWNLPYRMITYYRYYRFYADGTCMKMITVLEPKKVVPRLHRGYKVNEDSELLEEMRKDEGDKVIESPVDNFNNRNWLRMFAGTYHLTLQGDVETNCDGPVEKYRFIDKFKIVNSGKYHRHNKLEWVDLGYYDTVNRTHSSLSRENEKDFLFSRVKSYSY